MIFFKLAVRGTCSVIHQLPRDNKKVIVRERNIYSHLCVEVTHKYTSGVTKRCMFGYRKTVVRKPDAMSGIVFATISGEKKTKTF